MSNIRLPSILLEGLPSMGKTTSLKYLNANPEIAAGVLYISGDNKVLPWLGSNTHFKRYTLQCPTQLPAIIRQAGGSGDFHTIIVDTLTRVAETYQSCFIGSAVPKYAMNGEAMITDPNYVAVTKQGKVDGMSGWGRMASLIRDTLAAGDTSGCQMIYMSHMSNVQKEDGGYQWQAPIQGQIGKIGLESYFTICLVARSIPVEKLAAEPDHPLLGKTESRPGTGQRYVFQVEKTSDTMDYPVRIIDGMFPEGLHYIDNDMASLLNHLTELYGEEADTVIF